MWKLIRTVGHFLREAIGVLWLIVGFLFLFGFMLGGIPIGFLVGAFMYLELHIALAVSIIVGALIAIAIMAYWVSPLGDG